MKWPWPCKVYGVLGQKEFREYVKREHENRGSDNIEMVDLLHRLMEHQCEDMELEDIHLAIIVIVEEYSGPTTGKAWKTSRRCSGWIGMPNGR